MNYFANIPKDFTAVIGDEKELTIADHPAYYRKWLRDGIKGESLIFLSDDVDVMSDRDLKHMIGATDYPKMGSGFTMQRSINGYTCVDFNFVLQ